MARAAREISENGLYHIVFRGINKQHIFEEESDYKKLIEILLKVKEDINYEIYVYCFMSNHVHMVLKEYTAGDISLIMKRVLTKYARWYNIKYSRSGALIANRYKSKPLEVDEYFLSVIRYIHQNPLKAGLVKNIDDYKWCSYNEYISGEQGLAQQDFVLGMIEKDEFIEYHKHEEKLIFLVDDKVKITDEEIRRRILKQYAIEPNQIISLDKKERNMILSSLKKEFSIRQLERVTGVSRGVIHKS